MKNNLEDTLSFCAHVVLRHMEFRFADRYEGVTGSAIRAIFSLLADPEIISFAGGNPAPESFPKDKMAEFASDLIRNNGDVVLQYGGTSGVQSLLGEIKKSLEEEGLKPQMNELITLTGSSQGIDFMGKAFINPGDVVLVESPTFLGAIQTFKLNQAKLVEVQMDESGVMMDDLEKKLKEYSPKFIYTIPTFQNPTGRTLPADRRKKMVELCREYNCIVLEDDPYGKLRYSGEAQPSIKSFDKEGDDSIVVRLISYSKTISPGLRVGAAYAHRDIIHKFVLAKQGADVHSPNLTQEMAARYLAEGCLPEGIKHNCELYSDKLTLMCDLAEKYFPEGTKLVRPEGGMFIWLELPENISATEMFQEAVNRKVAYVPGTHFYANGGHNNTLRLNFTMVSEDKIEKGMKILGEMFSE